MAPSSSCYDAQRHLLDIGIMRLDFKCEHLKKNVSCINGPIIQFRRMYISIYVRASKHICAQRGLVISTKMRKASKKICYAPMCRHPHPAPFKCNKNAHSGYFDDFLLLEKKLVK